MPEAMFPIPGHPAVMISDYEIPSAESLTPVNSGGAVSELPTSLNDGLPLAILVMMTIRPEPVIIAGPVPAYTFVVDTVSSAKPDQARVRRRCVSNRGEEEHTHDELRIFSKHLILAEK